MEINKEVEEQLNINPKILSENIAQILLRNVNNKLTVELLNGVMLEVNKEIKKEGDA